MAQLDPAADRQRQAARVAAHADLRDVRLLSVEADIERFVTDQPLSFDLDMSQKVEYVEDESNYFVVRIAFELSVDFAEPTPGRGDTEVFGASFEYGALYELSEMDAAATENELQAYAETASTLTLYPYAREFVSSLTERFGLPRLTLPPYRLPSPWHEPDE